MSEFKSQAEVWQALLEGKIVADISRESKYKFERGSCWVALLDQNSVYQPCDQSFYQYKKYNSYIESKPKKIVRMAPLLVKFNTRYIITATIYPEEESKDNIVGFVKWLIDTHGVEVEVDDENQ